MNGERYAQITGWGMAVPERVLTNADLTKVVDTTDEWIVSRTGIQQRHVVASEKESTMTLATRAARRALRVADLAPIQLGLVIVATATPEYSFPSTASLVQDALGATNAGAFDLSAGCSGFIYALSVASDIIRSGDAEHVLVIGAETLTRITDWTDRNTCVLFGDGAGAVVVSAWDERCGVQASVLGSDGSGGDVLILPAGGSHAPTSHETVSSGGHFIKMNGREVFRFATTIIPKATEAVVEKAGWQLADLALVIPHQANIRIIESTAKRLRLPLDKFFVNLERYGNTSSASIPIALCEVIDGGRVKAGDKLVLVGFGAGLTWAAAAIEWGVPTPVKPQPWPRRWLASLRFALATIRSTVRRAERRVYNWAMGPVGKEDWRGRLRQRVDRWRGRGYT
ncbi:MAG: 3-oxoacyl-ACP synthase [Chloroflexi bacterium HGW-Chloroflexi-1]|nr:MAG: 3-oxoacyl-ACP synthase [Chloroflexi bacterium HGW-Chloroflexi-1]